MVFDLPKEQSSIIKVIGVGGGGSNAVNYMFAQGIRGVNFVICNTDSQALESSPVPNKIQLGPFLTEGLGAGADPEVGKRAAEESIEDIKKILEKNTKMVFITAGMGGGTGTGGAPVVAKIAREMGILTVGIVTRPFRFEGNKRVRNAEEGIEAIRKHVDSLIIISNDRVLEIYKNLKRSEAFGKANDILTTAAKSTSEIITYPGEINVDFADVQSVMRSGGVALMGHAVANGEDRAKKAVEEALSSPLLNDNNIYGAKKVLINIIAGKGDNELSMAEIEDITTYVQDAAGETADVFFGTSDDENLGDSISLTVIATGFEAGSAQQNISRKDTVQTTQPVVTVAPPVVEEQKIEVVVVVEEVVETQLEEVVETPLTEVLVAEEETVVVAEVLVEETVVAEEEVIIENEAIVLENEVVAVEETIEEEATVVTEEEVIISENEEIVTETATVVEEELITVAENEVVEEEAMITPDKIVFSLEDEVEEETIVAVTEHSTEALVEEDIAVNDSIVFTAGNGYDNEVDATEEVAAENIVEEVNPNAAIFEFDLDNNAVAQEEEVAETPEINNDLFGSMTVFTKEETQEEVAKEANPLMQQVQQTTYDRVRQLEKLSNRFNNQHAFNELEKVPAYKRKNIQLDFNTQPSAQNNSSEYNYNRNEDGSFEIRKNNSHISDNVD